jgi:hypothetical protein
VEYFVTKLRNLHIKEGLHYVMKEKQPVKRREWYREYHCFDSKKVVLDRFKTGKALSCFVLKHNYGEVHQQKIHNRNHQQLMTWPVLLTIISIPEQPNTFITFVMLPMPLLQLQLFQQVHQMIRHPNLLKKAMLISSMMIINVFTFLKQCLQDFLKKGNNSDGNSGVKKINQPSKAQLKVAGELFRDYKLLRTKNNTSQAVQWIKIQNLFINLLVCYYQL